MLISGSVVETKTGQVIGLTCVIHDITERKMMEERLLKAERLASIGQLAGQIGHDLRNPLAGIKNGVYLVKKKGNRINEQEREEILKVIEAAIEDSNRIVTTLIEYSSELTIEPHICTPKSLTSNALSKVRVPDYVHVQNNVLDDKELFLDAPKIEKVFASIIQNAIESIEESGTLKICGKLEEENLEVTFTDTGIGIPQEMLTLLFTPLVTNKAKGMGMSLAICKRVVEAHGGRIAVKSTLGKGTVLMVSLPVKSSKTEFAQAQLVTSTPSFV